MASLRQRRPIGRALLALALVLAACGGAVGSEPGQVELGDGGTFDAGLDAGALDGGLDAGQADAGLDAGELEGGSDAGALDGGAQDAGPLDAGPLDAGLLDAGAPDAGRPDAGATCAVSGAPGICIEVTACAALADHSSYPGHCPGAADIECCIDTPNPADNPPFPAGYKLMRQAQVTQAMTTWAVDILHDPVTYPMFSTTTRTFGALLVLARVEWHPPDFQNGIVHRGVTLYTPG